MLRSGIKAALARVPFDAGPADGTTLLIHHRVGGGTADELDLPTDQLVAQLDVLVGEGHDVLSLDAALDRLDARDPSPSVVLTFDDGFADIHDQAWPLLRERQLPFTIYLAAGLVGGEMRWEGSVAASQGAPALTWEQLDEMVRTGLCTVGNHTWDHARPEALDVAQLERCSAEIEDRLGIRPAHFAWTWGVEVPSLVGAVRERFRSAATGRLGRNAIDADRHALRRVPVRRTDPLPYYRAKLRGELRAERTYATVVGGAKALRRAVRRG